MHTNWTTAQLNLRCHRRTVLIWLCVSALFLILLLLRTRAEAWVAGYQPFPEGEAFVNMTPYCRAENCEINGLPWYVTIRSAFMPWNRAGSGFLFREISRGGYHDPCQPYDGEVIIIVATPDRMCPGDGPMRWAGRTEVGLGWARIYLNPDAGALEGRILYPLLLHEFGHVVGLGHPDQVGQDVIAVMNSVTGDSLDLHPDDIAGIRALYPNATTRPDPASSAGRLEMPGPGVTLSGIGVISGWKCDVLQLTVRFNGGLPIPLLYGVERKDVRDAGVCDHERVGFVSLMNWGELGPGTHTAVVYDDGLEFDRATFTVVTLGEAFLRGQQAEHVLQDFPHPGQAVKIEWREALQNFVIVEHYR